MVGFWPWSDGPEPTYSVEKLKKFLNLFFRWRRLLSIVESNCDVQAH